MKEKPVESFTDAQASVIVMAMAFKDVPYEEAVELAKSLTDAQASVMVMAIKSKDVLYEEAVELAKSLTDRQASVMGMAIKSGHISYKKALGLAQSLTDTGALVLCQLIKQYPYYPEVMCAHSALPLDKSLTEAQVLYQRIIMCHTSRSAQLLTKKQALIFVSLMISEYLAYTVVLELAQSFTEEQALLYLEVMCNSKGPQLKQSLTQEQALEVDQLGERVFFYHHAIAHNYTHQEALTLARSLTDLQASALVNAMRENHPCKHENHPCKAALVELMLKEALVEHNSLSMYGNKDLQVPVGYQDVAMDGFCFYHAVLQLHNPDGHTAEGLQAAAMNHVLTHLDHFQEFIIGLNIPGINEDTHLSPYQAMQAYINHHLGHHGQNAWADHLMIQAVAEVLGVNINVNMFNADGSHQVNQGINLTLPFVAEAAEQTIALGNIANMHFVAALPVAETDPAIVVVTTAAAAAAVIQIEGVNQSADNLQVDLVIGNATQIAALPTGEVLGYLPLEHS